MRFFNKLQNDFRTKYSSNQLPAFPIQIKRWHKINNSWYVHKKIYKGDWYETWLTYCWKYIVHNYWTSTQILSKTHSHIQTFHTLSVSKGSMLERWHFQWKPSRNLRKICRQHFTTFGSCSNIPLPFCHCTASRWRRRRHLRSWHETPRRGW